jgi:hypothetical protein
MLILDHCHSMSASVQASLDWWIGDAPVSAQATGDEVGKVMVLFKHRQETVQK